MFGEFRQMVDFLALAPFFILGAFLTTFTTVKITQSEALYRFIEGKVDVWRTKQARAIRLDMGAEIAALQKARYAIMSRFCMAGILPLLLFAGSCSHNPTFTVIDQNGGKRGYSKLEVKGGNIGGDSSLGQFLYGDQAESNNTFKIWTSNGSVDVPRDFASIRRVKLIKTFHPDRKEGASLNLPRSIVNIGAGGKWEYRLIITYKDGTQIEGIRSKIGSDEILGSSSRGEEHFSFALIEFIQRN